MMAASMINTDFIRKHPAQAVLTVLGLSGVVLIFLPFGDDYVATVVFIDSLPPSLPPFEDWDFGIFFWWLAPFVLLPFAIFAGYLRWLLTGRLSRGEAGAGYALALLVAGSLVVVDVVDSWGHRDVWVVYYPIAFGAGAAFVIQNLRSATLPVTNALVTMQVVYLPAAVFWISIGGVEFSEFQIGYYLAIVTVIAYSAQIIMVAKRPWHALIFFVPFALATGLIVWELNRYP